jgi:hypothetical protein
MPYRVHTLVTVTLVIAACKFEPGAASAVPPDEMGMGMGMASIPGGGAEDAGAPFDGRSTPDDAGTLGGAGSSDATTADDATMPGPSIDGGESQYGDPCIGSCFGRLACFEHVGRMRFPGGYCSEWCSLQNGTCRNGSVCGVNAGLYVCLGDCDPSAGRPCRSGYECCSGSSVVSGQGWCVPGGVCAE